MRKTLHCLTALTLALSLLLCAAACAQADEGGAKAYAFTDAAGIQREYYALLPDDYDASGRFYPTLYMMPPDGYSPLAYFAEGIDQRLRNLSGTEGATDFIVIFPIYQPDDDVFAVTQALITQAEAEFRAMPGAKWRAALGADTGGYLALLLGLTDGAAAIPEPALFAAVGSQEGLLSGDDNPWFAKHGNLCDMLSADPSGLGNFYTYVDACAESDAVYLPGGTADLCAVLRGSSVGFDYNAFEYSLRTADWYGDRADALGRPVNRFSLYFARNVLAASFASDRHAISSDVDAIRLRFTVDVNEDALAALLGGAEGLPYEISAVMSDPVTGDELFLDASAYDNLADTEGELLLDPGCMAQGESTGVSVSLYALGLTVPVGQDALVRVADPVYEGALRSVDLMGDWFFNAYKKYAPDAFTNEDMDNIGPVSGMDITAWDRVQPGLGWWTADFAASLGGDANYAGFAWYARTFELPEGFDDSGLYMAAGMFDEADEVFINGVLVGSIGFDTQGGNYDGSNPWDVNRLYPVPQGVLKSGENAVFVRTCNSSGGGGWYTGPIGLYTMAAYNRKVGLPSGEVDKDTTDKVLALVEAQRIAIETGDITGYMATVDEGYFDKGVTKSRLGSEAQLLISLGVTIVDTNAAVYGTQTEDGTALYLYQAERAMTDASGLEDKQTVALYFADAGDGIKLYGSHSRFFTDSTYSAALGGMGTYHVYLPEGYFDDATRYPVVYMLHGFGSTGLSFQIAGVPGELDRGMAEGDIRRAIVVFPDDGTRYSWWRDAYATWVTDDLTQWIDGTLRTIPDRRFRVIAGESMGGGGAYNLLLTRGDLYCGIIDIYGAINYSGALQMAVGVGADYLGQFTHYLYAGNHDSYTFDTATTSLARHLRSLDVPRRFFVDNGEHSSAFYLPFIRDAFAYTLGKLPQITDDGDMLTGEINSAVLQPDGSLAVTCTLNFTKAAALAEEALPNAFTPDKIALPVVIPTTLCLWDENDVAVFEQTLPLSPDSGDLQMAIPASFLAAGGEYRVSLSASVMNLSCFLDEAPVE